LEKTKTRVWKPVPARAGKAVIGLQPSRRVSILGRDTMKEKKIEEKAFEGFKCLESLTKGFDEERIEETLHLLCMGISVCDTLSEESEEMDVFAGHKIIFHHAFEDLQELLTFYRQAKIIEKKILAA
jgi:hypothetical protein